MYTHIGGKRSLKSNEIIAIINLDATMVSRPTLDFLRTAEEEGFIEKTSSDIPKTAIISETRDKKSKIYLTNVASQTIRKRIQKGTNC